MKKQQILWTIGACALITISFAVLFAYLIPEFKAFFSLPFTPTPITDSHFQVELNAGKLEINGKPLIHENTDLIFLSESTPSDISAERSIGRNVIVSDDRKTICFDVNYPDSGLVDTFCVNAMTNKLIWAIQQWKGISPGDAPESTVDNEKYTHISDIRVDNRTEYLLHASDAAFASASYRQGFAQAFVQVAKQISDYNFPEKYAFIGDLNRKAFDKQDSEWIDQHYLVTFYSTFNEVTATIAFKYGEDVGAEFNLHRRGGEWQEIPDTSRIDFI